MRASPAKPCPAKSHIEGRSPMDEQSAPADILDELDLGGGSSARSDNVAERPHIQGRMPEAPYVSYERDLTEADIAALSAPRGTRPKSLVRIHASHHSLARCLAAGMKHAQAALVTGYSSARIGQLVNDESFTALVADYRNEVKSVFADMAERMSDLSLDAIELLQERLHAAPEQFTTQMLLEVVKTFADRTGHGPGQEVHLKMDRDLIDRPPRETFDEWEKRRAGELARPAESDGTSLVTPAGASTRGYNGRLVS